MAWLVFGHGPNPFDRIEDLQKQINELKAWFSAAKSEMVKLQTNVVAGSVPREEPMPRIKEAYRGMPKEFYEQVDWERMGIGKNDF